MKISQRLLILSCVVSALSGNFDWQVASGQTKLLRYPDIHEDQIVFCYGSDLWRVSSKGGTAERLTSHPGIEVFPKFSPDGKQIAFTGQYEGDEQVYVIDTAGGVPRQITFYPANGPLPDRWGYDHQVYGWHPDGKSILFRSMRYGWGLTDARLFSAPIDGGLAEPLPMQMSGAGDYSPDGTKVAFSPLARDFRTWKRYQGGWAQDLYIFDLATHESKKITDDPRTDRDPMWIGDRVYFSSDRSGTLNLYFYDVTSGKTTQVTDSETFDVRWPSKGGTKIVYELGGELYVMDTSTHASRKISVTVPTDGLAFRPRRVSAANAIEQYSLSPDGKRVLIVGRGDVFTVPAEKGPTRNLTKTSGAHEKWASWSPDGSHIAYLSDATGEEELYVMDPRDPKKAQQVTQGGQAMRYRPLWSPDNRSLAFSDKNGKVFVLNVATQDVQEIADDTEGMIQDYTWSPDSQYLAFTMANPNGMGSIYIWSMPQRELQRVTDDLFDDRNPAWDPAGNYLYYLSDREFAPQIDGREWNFANNRQAGIFALGLRGDVPHPYPPESDEVEVKEDEKTKTDKPGGKKENADEGDPSAEKVDAPGDSPLDVVIRFFDERNGTEETKVKDQPSEKKSDEDELKEKSRPIEFDGLADRVARVPVPADNIGNLSAVKGQLFYGISGPFYYGRESDRESELMTFSHKDRTASSVAKGVQGYEISFDEKKLLLRTARGFEMRDVATAKSDGKPVTTAAMMVWVDPRQEWRQMYHEVWRRFRDFFYVENMHGYDWAALRDQYEPLLDHVAHRSDLNYVIGEMIAELNVGHAYIAGGEFDRPTRPDVALPGAIFELDREAQRYRLARIYRGHNQEDIYRSPLTEMGVTISKGEYILAIDGEELQASDDPYEKLRFKSGHPVTFSVGTEPDLAKSRDVTFRPLTSESNLIYLNMVLDNRDKVLAATKGDVGYLHIPDMGANGIREFCKWYYGQRQFKGLIIDVRSNGGGNISQMVIERLARTLLATGMPRNDDTTNTYPYTMFHGHLVCLLDEDSASDGDIFPAMFREKGLGPLIGKRSWGGVIGITNRGMLIDGGTVNVPEFGFASKDGHWIIEGEGVYPDIDVDNDPQSLADGQDRQLDIAIQVIQRKIRLQPRELPKRPEPPDRSKHPSR